MTILDLLDAIAMLSASAVAIMVVSVIIYWVYAERRIHYLEARLWLRGIEKNE